MWGHAEGSAGSRRFVLGELSTSVTQPCLGAPVTLMTAAIIVAGLPGSEA